MIKEMKIFWRRVALAITCCLIILYTYVVLMLFAVYVRNNFEFSRIYDLEDEHLQTIWLKGGFKNSKHGLYCHMYREHSSNIGGSTNSQEIKLN